MAGDLIPPPSPAGRPAPDQELPPAAPEQAAAAEPAPAGTPGPSEFRGRFGFLTGALAGCGVAAAVLLVVLLSGGGGSEPAGSAAPPADDWSPWRPQATGAINGAQEIAAEIEGNYKNAKAKKLTGVKGGPIAVNTLPISVAIPAAGGRFQVVGGSGLQYTLAGFGEEGRLTDSDPSAARRRLLRREALELSLYTFHYLPDVSMVVALLPPAPTREQFHPEPEDAAAAKAAKRRKPVSYQRQALFYRRYELREPLGRPLGTTMAITPPKIGGLAGREARRIDELTLPNLFTYKHIQQQDGSVYLVLDRPE